MSKQAVIDLKIIKQNAEKIKSMLPAGTKFCAVVKADAYGHGREKVAGAICKLVDFFAVASVEEGIALRRSGIKNSILVFLKPDKNDIKRAIENDLSITLTGVSQLRVISGIAKKLDKKAKIHIKYNTGMNRHGVNKLSELDYILKCAGNDNHILIEGLYSHYSNPESKKSITRATDKFLLAINLVKGYNRNVICHISASGGFIRDKFFDMVRIGILLYGYTPFKTDKITVKPAMKIYSSVISSRKIKKGDSALYGDKKTHKDISLSIIDYGYADGLDRKTVKGQFSNRCMDVSAITTNSKNKRKVLILDNADILARQYNTINYEILVKSAIKAEKIYKY